MQPFEDVIARLGLPQLELGAAPDDLAPELDEALDQLEQVHHLRPAADDGQHDDAEARLQRRVLVEVVEHDLRHFAALQLDDDPHAVAVGLVAQIGDAFDGLLAHQIGDALDQLRLVDLIRNLGDDDRLPIALLVRLDRRSRAHQDRAAAGRVRLDGAVRGRRCSRRSGSPAPGISRIRLPQLLAARVRSASSALGLKMRVLDQPDAAVDDLAQVVRRHVGRHADGDAGRAVDQQVRETAPAGRSALRWSRRSSATKSTVSLSRSAIMSSASACSRASVYRIAAGGSPSIDPKLPWPSTSG